MLCLRHESQFILSKTKKYHVDLKTTRLYYVGNGSRRQAKTWVGHLDIGYVWLQCMVASILHGYLITMPRSLRILKKYHAPSKCWFCIRILFFEVGRWARQCSASPNSMYGLVLDHMQKININWRSPTSPISSKINKISRGPKISWFHHDRNYQLYGHGIVNYRNARPCMMMTFVCEWKIITQATRIMDFKKYHQEFLRDIF